MRLSTAVSAIGLGTSLIAKDVAAFTSAGLPSGSFRTRHVLSMADGDAAQPAKKKLSVSDIMAGGNKQVEQGGPGEVKAADNFSEDILADMQACLQKLDKRAKEGPGSLSGSDVSDFEAAMARIVADLDVKLQQGASPSTVGAGNSGSNVSVSSDAGSAPAAPAAPAAAAIPPPPPPPPPPPQPKEEEEVMDTSLDEGPKYTGKGGMGLASGTRNTYVIDGMDEMTGPEYRKALQASVSNRQEQRRKSKSGVVGNRAAHSYLEDLGYGGASSSLASQTDSSSSSASSSDNAAAKKSFNPFNGPKKSDGSSSSSSPPKSNPTDWSNAKFSQPDPVIYHGSHRVPESFENPDMVDAHKITDKFVDGKGKPEIKDTSLDEGPKYDGTGGMGMAKGTRSTYVIPGMDEMTGPEYRKALQESVSNLQVERRKAKGGAVGNRAVKSYLDDL